jgi:hypothetical protein
MKEGDFEMFYGWIVLKDTMPDNDNSKRRSETGESETVKAGEVNYEKDIEDLTDSPNRNVELQRFM